MSETKVPRRWRVAIQFKRFGDVDQFVVEAESGDAAAETVLARFVPGSVEVLSVQEVESTGF